MTKLNRDLMEGKVSAEEAKVIIAEFERIGKEKRRFLKQSMKDWMNKEEQ